MLKKFLRNEEGNYAVIFSLAALPIFGAVGMSVDFSNVSRLKYDMTNSVDAAGIEVSQLFTAGETNRDTLLTKANKFFKSNFDHNYVDYTELTLTLPNDEGNTSKELRLKGKLTYHTLFGPVMAALTGSDAGKYVYVIEEATLKMRTMAEIALVLDNSGSMSDSAGTGTRMDLVKEASKQLISEIMTLGAQISQVQDPVKFSLVPFAGSVNIGNTTAIRNAGWMDQRGVSPVQHENLNWGVPGATNPTGYLTTAPDGAKLNALGQPLSRFSIYDSLRFLDDGAEVPTVATCAVWRAGLGTSTTASNATTANCAVFSRAAGIAKAPSNSDVAAEMGTSVTAQRAKYEWKGCVEARPYPFNLNDTEAAAGAPGSYFVPWFAPDDYNNQRYGVQSNSSTSNGTSGYNNWWPDNDPANAAVTVAPVNAGSFTATWQTGTARPRETNVAKYFQKQMMLYGSGTASSTSATRKGQWHYFKGAPGPNAGCTTTAITPLTTSTTTLNTAIDAMQPNGATNVTEGLAWGWRTVSSTAPFTEGKVETRKDIDKVVIVITDGKNTYYTPDSLGYTDYAANKSIYSTHGYPGWNGTTGTNGTATQTSATNRGRIFQNTSVSATDYSNANYSTSMIQQMNALCTNVKTAKVILMTIALDLNPAAAPAGDGAMITALSQCAGDSRTRKESNGSATKLFWNACATNSTSTSCKSLTQVFKEVADELSNLRFTG